MKLRSKSSGFMPWNCDIPGGMPRLMYALHLDAWGLGVGIGAGVGAGCSLNVWGCPTAG